MKGILSILICLISITTQAQTFKELIQRGRNLYNQEKYLESAEKYDKAFKRNEGDASQYYKAACSWALSGDTINSMKYLNLAADKGWEDFRHIKIDKDLWSLHLVKGWDSILDKIKVNLEEYEKNFDKPLQKQLEKIFVRDQTLRQLHREAEDKFGIDSDEMNYFWELISKQDSLNELEVINIIDKRGWVGKTLVGEKANTALWLVIQHAPIEIQEKYLSLFKESVKAGESNGRNLALLVDRIQMRKGEPQTYGSQIIRDEKTENPIVYKVFEPEYVNQRRKEVGLGPIEDYVKRWGIEWTIEQKEK